MKIRECLVRAERCLSNHLFPKITGDSVSVNNGVSETALEAEVLMRHILGMDRTQFFLELEAHLSLEDQRQVNQSIARRLNGEPVAYIVGCREFYGLNLAVNAQVLVPRPETELLVDKVLEFASAKPREEFLRVIDVGTGSGAIAIAVACNSPESVIYATDVRCEALMVADINRRRHGVSNRVHLCQGDLLKFLNLPADVIVSNPPYICTEEIPKLSAEVKQEPRYALDGGVDGLEVTRRFLRQASALIRPGGLILLEIAPQALEQVRQLALHFMPGGCVSFAKDLMGLPRVVMISHPDGDGDAVY